MDCQSKVKPNRLDKLSDEQKTLQQRCTDDLTKTVERKID
jgi:hypothetical protein